MQFEPDSFDLKSLSAQTGVAPRTVHFYVQQGLLPPPDGAGRGARYNAVHRDRLRLIRRLQEQHLPLAEIRKHLDRIPDHMLEEVVSSPTPPKPKSAADYIRSVLGSSAPRSSLSSSSPPGPPPGALRSAPMKPTSARPSGRPVRPEGLPDSPDMALLAERGVSVEDAASLNRAATERSQWERFAIDPDVEIHVRRPGSRASNRKVEKLIEFARSIFKEDA